MRRCSKCGKNKKDLEFYVDKRVKRNLYAACKECYSKHNQEIHLKLKQTAFYALGNKCVRCGFDDARALQVDHIQGGGHVRRRTIGENTRTVYRKIINGNHDEFQLLCANCNYIKRIENLEAIGRPKFDYRTLS